MKLQVASWDAASGPCLLEALETYPRVEGIAVPPDTVGTFHFRLAEPPQPDATLAQMGDSAAGYRVVLTLVLGAVTLKTIRAETDSLLEVTGRSILTTVAERCLAMPDSLSIQCSYLGDSTRQCPSERVAAT